MPALLILAAGFGVVIAISMVIPLVASAIVTALIGRQAKFDGAETFMTGIIFYLVMAVLFGGSLMLYGESVGYPILDTIIAIVAGIFWPFPIGILGIQAFYGDMQPAIEAFSFMALGVFVTQIIVVFQILIRARQSVK